MAARRELRRAYVEVTGGPSPPTYDGRSLTGAKWLYNAIRRLLEDAGIQAHATLKSEYANVCAECGQEFGHDRFGCCPHCGTPVTEVAR